MRLFHTTFTLLSRNMSKRARSPTPPFGGVSGLKEKKPKTEEAQKLARKVATPEAAAAVDAAPPYIKLRDAMKAASVEVAKGDAVVYWHRMEDVRISDNRALSLASQRAVQLGVPLITLFVISPDDYHAHDRSARRVDFVLRNLAALKETYAEMHIPLHTITHTPRRSLPERVMNFLQSVNAKHIFGNLEYPVDELRRDLRVCLLAKEQGVKPVFVHDKLIIEPGKLSTLQGKPYTVYSPFQKTWINHLNNNLDLLQEAPPALPNNPAIHSNATFEKLFSTPVPDHVEGFDCSDREMMEVLWPESTAKAREILHRFVYTRSRTAQLGPADPLTPGAEVDSKHSRLLSYADGRNRADRDTSSRISPYLAAGVLSVRECIREVLKLTGKKTVDGGKDTGVGNWIQELAWRDFYSHLMVAFPRVSMGRPFQEKFSKVRWEVNDDFLRAWQEGRTGVPIVDAGMRQCNQMGWMHNRVRMITASYLTKNLMIDWRLGEKYFMESFVDGDLASNDSGWQWIASTGADAQPVFRIFNPYSQSLKADPTGDFIRTFVPELSQLQGKDIHNPPAAIAKKLGYPLPIVDYAESRARALRRYKNPGEE